VLQELPRLPDQLGAARLEEVLTRLDPADVKLITNDEVLAVDQAGIPATPLSRATPQQVWTP
jgi:hypothetical protein